MGLSRTARYYKYGSTIPGVKKPKNSKKARSKKRKTDSKINKRKEQVKKRVESNRARRKAKKSGKKIKGKDYDHAVKKFVKSSTNRGRKNEGGRKKRKNKNKGPK